MRYIFNILFCFLLSYSIGNAQSIKRSVISSVGNSSSTSSFILESTFGQPSNIGTVSDGNNFIRQGFQQPINNLISIFGCTDSLASNFNPFATIDDGTCLYSPFIFGCMDSTASNYNPLATVDDSSCCYSSNELWSQIGQDVDGIGINEWNGWSTDISADGSIIAMGAILNDAGGTNSGHVRVFENISGTWTQLGQDIDGENAQDWNGYSISLSSDGSILAVGALSHDANGSNSGRVRVFENISGTWTQIGQSLDGVGAGDSFGLYVDLSDNGSILAVGAPYATGSQISSGHVQVFENISGTWTQVGQNINGDLTDDSFGWSVSFNNNGNILAIGAYGAGGFSNNINGYVKVFENISGSWTQIGQDLIGDNLLDEFGISVSLSGDGSILAVGADGHDGNGSNSGLTRVFENIAGTWIQLGQDIYGEVTGDLSGYKVSLSDDGTILASSVLSNNNGGNTGQVRVFKNNYGSWTKIAQEINGENTSDNFGKSLALNNDGTMLVAGAHYNSGNGAYSGHVRVYDSGVLCDDYGCLDPLALNFDPSATIDDSSCVYPLYGCIDSLAFNYNSLANISDSSCFYCYTSESDTFFYTGGIQSFIVPEGVDSINVYLSGAQGGDGQLSSGGLGGSISAQLAVSQFDTLFLFVGEEGADYYSPASISYNNGGSGGTSNFGSGGGGGGRSHISLSSFHSNTIERIIVAGAGGGGSSSCGGLGGGLIGGNGCGPAAGNGGTQSFGGSGGNNWPINQGISGNMNLGGAGNAGGGGGSGHWGGGGGAANSGGGGGSSYTVDSISSNIIHFQGNNSGHGKIIISYSNTSTNTIVVSACGSYDWDGITYDSTGIYTNVYTAYSGCDSTVILNLTINNSTTDSVVVSSCDSYGWDGVTYDSTGLYTNVYTGLNGCDSTVILDLIINQSDTSFTNITACDSVEWNGNWYDSSGTYFSNSSNSNLYSLIFDGDDDITFSADLLPSAEKTVSLWFKTDNIGINPNLGNTMLAYGGTNNSPSGATSWIMNVGNACGSGTNTFEVQNHWNQNMVSYNFGTQNFNSSWHHWAVTTDSSGTRFYLDGILVTTSPIFISNINTINKDLIIGSCVSPNGLGAYEDACVEKWIGNLDDVQVWDYALSQTEIQNFLNCPPFGNESGLVGYWNFEEGSGNIVYDKSSNSIDGIINGAIYSNDAPIFACHFLNQNGCDSIAVLNLTINNSSSNTVVVSACDNYDWGGVTYDSTGLYTNIYSDVNGCDSTVTLDLTINNSTTNTIIVTDCNSYDWDGVTYFTTGLYSNIYSGVNGCDSTVTLDLTINYTDTNFINVSTCDSFTIGNQTYTQSGIYYQTVSVDSISGFNFVGIYNESSYYISENPDYWGIAQSNCVNNGGNLVCISDSNENNFVSNLLPGQQFWIGYTDEIIEGSFVWVDGSTNSYTKWAPTEPSNSGPTGNEDYTLINTSEGGSNPLNGYWNDVDDNMNQYLYVLEIPNNHLTTNGCDSVLAIDLTINNSTTNTVVVTACDSYDWDGFTYSTTGLYTNLYSDTNGCDSTVTLDLTINNSTTNTIVVTACDSYDWDGVTYSTTGLYTNLYSDINGCDSTVTLDLTINNSITNTVVVTACDSYDWDGVTYSTTGLYSNLYSGVNGCDSTVTLDLTINYTSSSYNLITSCGSYNFNGINLTIPGIYTDTLTDANSCDSIVTIDLSFGLLGCTDSTAFNYDSLAVCDDGSCIPIIYGCTDTSAVNYYSGANVDDGSCIYAGCTDSLASNYDSLATIDDGSCIYLQMGCTDSLACNYDPLAMIDDSTCLLNYGCMDPNAINYDSLANCNDPFACIYPVYGCTDPNAINYYSGANVDDGSCLYAGCTDPLACNYDSIAFFDDGSCLTDYGCTDSLALNYDSTATCDDGSCVYTNPCNSPKPTGLYAYDVIDTRAKIGWDNMNDSNCMVWKYFVRYREVGTGPWTTKSAGVGNGLCNFGLNTVTKQLLNLSPSTTYEFKMKAFYCGGTSSNYSPAVQFTTKDVCPDMTNLAVQTFNGNQAKAKFTWDTTGAYVFARILLRVDTAGAAWQTAGGFGVYYPQLFINKFGLTPGQSYRAQGRTFCDSNITAYRSPTWTAPIFWTQPGNLPIRNQSENTIDDLEIYPNPSRDIFNIRFISEEMQDVTIKILNVVGAEVYREDKDQFIGEYTKQINLNTYGKGIYFLEIETDIGIINKKLILQ